jgi:hypothetical protein
VTTKHGVGPFRDRIPEIKRRVDLLEEVTRRLGPPVSSRDGVSRWFCPRHQDAKPNFTVTISGRYAGRWSCWGVCNQRGDVIDLLVFLGEATSKRDAIEQLAARISEG